MLKPFLCILFLAPTFLLLPQGQSFEVVSLKPSITDRESYVSCHGADLTRQTSIPLGRCVARHRTLRQLIQFAYPILPRLMGESQILGGPDWIDSAFYDLEAKADDTSTATVEQLTQMLRRVLTEQFKLEFHRETKERSGYALVVGKDGSKLKPSAGPVTTRPSLPRGALYMPNAPIANFAELLSLQIKTPIVDKTGLQGQFDFVLNADETGDTLGPSIFTAVQEQLGLKLESEKIPFEFIVIDHADKPTPTPQ